VVGTRLPLFNDDRCTNHIACSRYVKYKFSWGSRATREGGVVRYFLRSSKVSCALIDESPLELVLFLKQFEEPPDVES
jgi:hypothetical protein